MRKVLSKVYSVLSLLVLLWVVASWLQVVGSNLGQAPSYSVWNLFNLIKVIGG